MKSCTSAPLNTIAGDLLRAGWILHNRKRPWVLQPSAKGFDLCTHATRVLRRKLEAATQASVRRCDGRGTRRGASPLAKLRCTPRDRIIAAGDPQHLAASG